MVLAIITLLIYAVIILIPVLFKKKAISNFTQPVSCNKSAVQVASQFLDKYNLIIEENPNENNDAVNTDNEKSEENNEGFEIDTEEVKEGFNFGEKIQKLKFNFSDDDKTLLNNDTEVIEDAEVSIEVDCPQIKEHKIPFGFSASSHRDVPIIKLGNSLIDKNTLSVAVISAYLATKIHCKYNKPFWSILLSVLLFPARCISQIAWFFGFAMIFGMYLISYKFMDIFFITSIVSLMLSLLNIFYYKHVADKTFNGLVEEDIIDDSEKTNTKKLLVFLMLSEISNPVSLFKLFLNKFMGYRV